MAQIFLHSLNIVPCPEAVDGKSMAKIMEAKVPKADLFHDRLIVPVECLVCNETSQFICKHKILIIVVSRSQFFCPDLL